MTIQVTPSPDRAKEQPFSESEEKIHGLYGLAKTYLKELNHSKAMKVALSALELNPQDDSLKGNLHFLLGRANLTVENFSQAAKAFQFATQYRPQNKKIEEAQMSLFNQLIKRNKVEKAMTYADEVCSLEATSPTLRSALREKQCFYLLSNFQFEEAERSVKVGTEQDPNDAGLKALNEWFEFMKKNCSSAQLCGPEGSALALTFNNEDLENEIAFLKELLEKNPEPSNTNCWFFCRLSWGEYALNFEKFAQDREKREEFIAEHLRTVDEVLSQNNLLPEVRAEWCRLGVTLDRKNENYIPGIREGFTRARYLLSKIKLTPDFQMKLSFAKELDSLHPSSIIYNLLFNDVVAAMLSTKVSYKEKIGVLSMMRSQDAFAMQLFPQRIESYVKRDPVFEFLYPPPESERKAVKLSTIFKLAQGSLLNANGNGSDAKVFVEKCLEEEKDEVDKEYFQDFIDRCFQS